MADSAAKPMRQQVEEYIRSLQDKIVASLEAVDPKSPPFKQDSWIRPQGGSGKSCVFAFPPSDNDVAPSHESVLEKAGVNISVVHGTLPPGAVKQMRADHSSLPEHLPGGLPFFAAGISLVIHPRNPHAPTVHANYRYFETTHPETNELLAWWFGGGCDLTPSYLYEEDAVYFHTVLKTACDAHGPAIYPAFKKWCDEYFFLPHRNETRGVGGLFFDDISDGPHSRLPESAERPKSPADIFKMVRELGDTFIPSYLPILSKRCNMPYTPLQRRWQLVRRGRYVEFNLLFDRGTKFGLMTPGARIESILMSLPEIARWEYMTELGEEGTEEGKVMVVLKTPREWV